MQTMAGGGDAEGWILQTESGVLPLELTAGAPPRDATCVTIQVPDDFGQPSDPAEIFDRAGYTTIHVGKFMNQYNRFAEPDSTVRAIRLPDRFYLARRQQDGVTTDDLLARTVFYKVGHHASHNATLVALFETAFYQWMPEAAIRAKALPQRRSPVSLSASTR